MAEKTTAEVIIGGKVYTLSGYEGEEYLQRVASYINNKMNELDAVEAFRRFPVDMKSVLVHLNIADDYFKAKNQIEVIEQEVKDKENELYDLKHELIATQIKLENMEKSLKAAQEELNRNAKDMIRLETELKESRKHSSSVV